MSYRMVVDGTGCSTPGWYSGSQFLIKINFKEKITGEAQKCIKNKKYENKTKNGYIKSNKINKTLLFQFHFDTICVMLRDERVDWRWLVGWLWLWR